MKTKGSDVSGVSGKARKPGTQREIDRFLRALSSYPDRYAREPHLSFEQHFSSIVTADQLIPDEEQRHSE
jgi:hypothetical protein